MEQTIYIPPISISIILIAVMILALAFRKQVKIYETSSDFRIPDILPSTGVEIPIWVSYSGVKWLRGLSLSKNVFNSKLVLFEDYMEYRTLILKTANYSQIKHVRLTSFLFFYLIRFTFNDRALTFSALVTDKDMLEHLAAFFRARNIPVISKY